MDASRWETLEELLEQALALPPDERAAFLDALDAADPHMRVELASLLAAYHEAPAFFDDLGHDLPAFDAPAQPLPAALPHDARIGPYRLIEEIGRGGMGRVFLAERADIDKRVALKLVRGGLAAPEAVQRFLIERRVLARLEHPHIARLLDAGMTDDETPFFAMEYVEGDSITDYCDRHRLSIDDRLHLFEQVGEAVQYAHHNLVVHRDLKPSNILVADGGTVKLLDFGIAKLLEDDKPEVRTRTGLRVMTPEYAAPEQVTGAPVTTATDVYALGIILYELLTGLRPYDVRTVPPAEAAQRILHTEPQKPSTAVSHATEDASIAEVRATTDERLRRRLQGDLDTIVLKALRKEPGRRYQSADQFLDDIKRHLAGLPVSARPDTASYRLRKFVQRNRLAASAVAAVILALSVGLSAALWQGRVAAAERDRAAQALEQSEEVSAFLENLLSAADPRAPTAERLDTLRVRALVDRSVAHVRDDLQHQPRLQARMLLVLGRVYTNLGLYEQADSLLEQAYTLYQRPDASARDQAEVNEALALIHHWMGQPAEAERFQRAAVARWHDAYGPTQADVAFALSTLGVILNGAGRNDEAIMAHEEAIAMMRSLGVPDSSSYAEMLNNLSTTYFQEGRYNEAEPLLRETVGIHRRLLGPRHPNVGIGLNGLATTLMYMGEDSAAVRLFEEAVSILDDAYNGRHLYLGIALQNLALLHDDHERNEEAEATYRRALAVNRAVVGDRHPDTGLVMHNLGLLLIEMEQFTEAEDLLREALSIFQEAYGEDNVFTAAAHVSLGEVLLPRQHLAEAETHLRAGLDGLQNLLPDDHRLVVGARVQWAGWLMATGEFEQAETLLLDAYRTAQADESMLNVRRENVDHLVTLYEAWGKPDSVAAWRARAEDA